jgi:phospholipid/cholesterol/gamma-HCH transport system ATP-binding protein
MVTVQDLHAGYGAKEILKGISFDVAPGEIRAILGGSGSGKSTLLRNVLGLESPWSGSARVLEEDLSRVGGAPMDVLSRIGVLFQGGALVTSLSVGQNVMLPLVLEGIEPKGAAQELARARLSQVGLENVWEMLPGELSGGMRKRAALARALIREPRILFCDEPSAGLDPLTSRGLDELLLELRESLGLTIVIVSHEIDSIRCLAQKILFLQDGLAVYDGPLDQAIEHGPQRVVDFFARRTDSTTRPSPTAWEIIEMSETNA